MLFLDRFGGKGYCGVVCILGNETFWVSGMDDFQKQALTEHLTELRKCLIYSVLATVAGFGVAYSYSKELGQLLFKPLYAAMPENSSLIFTSYQEGFFFI